MWSLVIVLELETNAVPESFTNGIWTIFYKRNIALSGLLVCWLIKSLTVVSSSKLSHSPSKLFGRIFIFRTLFQPRTLSVHIPAAWWDLFTKYVNIHMHVSDSFSRSKRASYRERTLLGIWRYIHRAHALQGIFSGSVTKRSGNSVPNPKESTPSWLWGPHWRLGRVQKFASPSSQGDGA